MTEARQISSEKKLAAKNLYASDMPEEFIAMQLEHRRSKRDATRVRAYGRSREAARVNA